MSQLPVYVLHPCGTFQVLSLFEEVLGAKDNILKSWISFVLSLFIPVQQDDAELQH